MAMKKTDMGSKICTKCKKRKLVVKFSKNKSCKDGLQFWCKECIKEYRENNKEKEAIRKKQWHKSNPEKVAIKQKRWRKENPQKRAIQQKRNREKHKEERVESARQYRQSYIGKESMRRSREKKRSTPKGKLNHSISTTVCKSLKQAGSFKNGCHWETLVGYKVEELKKHLESLFTEGMNWENYGYGKDKWCIDHKKPIISFHYDNFEHPDFKKCWALKNLQPMWCLENFSKGAKINGQ
jgi:hypothetical protein